MTEFRRHILAPQTGESWTPRYSAKQRSTDEPKLNPVPATKLTDQLAAETMHGHALIHVQSVNPGLTMDPLEERKVLVTAGPLGAPRKGERKGGG